MNLSNLRNRKEYRKRKAQIEKSVAYRQASRRLDKSENSTEKLIASYRRSAQEAERSGNHAQAVHFAAEASRLAKHLAVNGQMRSTVDTVYVIGEGRQALIDAMEATGQLAEDAASGMDPEEMIRAQLAYEMSREQVDELLEESSDAFGGMSEEDEDRRKMGESYLRSIMRTRQEEEKKRSSLLQDTNRKLDELLKNRSSEKQD